MLQPLNVAKEVFPFESDQCLDVGGWFEREVEVELKEENGM